jgi:ABC-type nitrate/sulfonate/bicarbonate transport system substrate-binding protein
LHYPASLFGHAISLRRGRSGEEGMIKYPKDRWSRRKVLRYMGAAAGSALAAPALHLSGSAAAQTAIPQKTIRFSMVNHTNHSIWVIAARRGYFEEVGITIDPPDGRTVFESQVVPVLQTGEVDISTIFLGVLTPVLHQIKNIRPFMNYSYFQGSTILTGPDSGFKTVDDFIAEGKTFREAAKATMEQLRGQKLTVPPSISTRPWLEFVYSFGDLKLEDSDLVIVEDPNAVQLAVSGQVPFVAPAGAVQIYQLEFQAGWRPLMSTRQMVKHAGGPDGAPVNRILNYDGFACSTEYLKANRDTIHRFNSVIYRTMDEIFGPNQKEALELYAPFINSVNGSSLDAGAIKFIFEEMDPFFPWEVQERLWTDKSFPLEYHNVYDYQIKKFIEDGTLPAGDYSLDDIFPSRAIWLEERAMKAEAEKLLADAEGMNLSAEKGALVEAGRDWITKYNFLDAVANLKAATS